MTLMIFIVVGFIIQLINSFLGMSYGLLSVAILLVIGTNPLSAVISVHISKIMTAITSGVSHYQLNSINRPLTMRLSLYGAIGSVFGALILMKIAENLLIPLVAFYLLSTGLTIYFLSLNQTKIKQAEIDTTSLGIIGGFVDAMIGGGWGAIVTSTLLAKGHNPHHTIGSVRVAEAFIACVIAVILIPQVSIMSLNWELIIGLSIGGVVGAPIGTYLCSKTSGEKLQVAVGTLVIILSISMIGGILL